MIFGIHFLLVANKQSNPARRCQIFGSKRAIDSDEFNFCTIDNAIKAMGMQGDKQQGMRNSDANFMTVSNLSLVPNGLL